MAETSVAPESHAHALPPEVAGPLTRVCAWVVGIGVLLVFGFVVRRGGTATLHEWPVLAAPLTAIFVLACTMLIRTRLRMLGFFTVACLSVTSIVGLCYFGFGPVIGIWLAFITTHVAVLVGGRALLGSLAAITLGLSLAAAGWLHGWLPLAPTFFVFRSVPVDALRWAGTIVGTVSGCAGCAAVAYFVKRALLDYAAQQKVVVASLAREQQLRAQAEVERLRAENEVERTAHQSDARLRAVFQAAPIGIALMQDRQVLEINDRIVDLFGYTRDELVGHSTRLLYPDDTSFARAGSEIVRTVTEAGVWEGELTFHHRRGHPIECLARIAPISPRDPAAGLVVMVFDLRERKRIEALRLEQAKMEALSRENAEHLREIFEHATEIIFVVRVDPGGRFVYERINQACATIGLSVADFCSGTKTPADLFPAEPAASIKQGYERCISAREPIYVDQSIPTSTGERAFSTVLVPIIAEDGGRVVRILGFARDQTEQRQAATALRRSEENYRSLFENSVVGLFRIQDGRYLSVNPALARMRGYDSPREMCDSITDIEQQAYFEPEQRAEILARLHRDGAIEGMELQIRRKDGSRMWELLNARLVRDPGTGATCIEGSALDITERKHAAELLQAKTAAEAANRAKSVFLANMSHEIRTPMNAILGFSQLLLRDPALTQAQRERLRIIDRNGEHLLALINDVLEMSKIEAHRIVLRPAAFELRGLAHDLETMFASRARAKGLEFRIEVSPDLPRTAVADEGRLRQIFVNLIANAVKFTARGSVAVHVGISGPATERILIACVSDTGPGIAAEDMPRLFRQFEQSTAGTQSGSGTGLGLAISRELARLMHGDITVDSTPGQGSRFCVSVPMPFSDEAAPPPPPLERDRTLRLADGQPACRVLIADDVDDNRRLLSETLVAAGFAVREVADGAEAVQEFDRYQPHAILMDLRMPGMDGNEATMRIRARPGGSRVKIITLSASVFVENREQMLAAGADDFLAKPFHDAQLFAKLEHLLGLQLVAAPVAPETPGTAAPNEPAADARPLPLHLVTALRQALDAADFDRALEMIRLVHDLDPALAAELRSRAERFDYDDALALLGGARIASEA